MKILILGYSNIFQRKIYFALKKFKNLEIEVASERKNKINLNINKHYTSYKKALDETEAKLVYISLINSQHFYWANKALNNNKHVIVDKPLTINFDQTKKLVNLASKKKLLLSESVVFHLHKQFRDVLSKININKPTRIFSNFHIPKLEKKNFRNFKKFGGGCFQDMSPYACYLIDIFFKNKKYLFKNKKNSIIIRLSIVLIYL